MPLYHGTPTLQHLLPPAGADSLEMIHAVVEQNRRRDRERIEVLEQEVAELREAVGLDRPAPRNVSKAQAKKEIRGYFAKHDGELIYPDDIADDLNLEMQQVIEICEALAEEGKIARKG